MKIGFCGMGKLGLPVALAVDNKNHTVYGYDINREVMGYLRKRAIPYLEKGVTQLLKNHNIVSCLSVWELVDAADVIFVPIQTPHEPRFEGTIRLPKERKDFDYSFLKEGIKNLAETAKKQKKKITVVTVSTCLPGTFEREIKPLLNKWINYIYNPFFIAMGTTVDDFLHPEFVLIGGDNTRKLTDFYETIHSKPIFSTDITTAEGIKVFYNTFITAKINLANAWMQVAHKTGMNVDDITNALSLATDRIISPKYMYAGGPDAGGCHPRDLIALSWLGKQIDLQPNVFEQMAQVRIAQTEWTVDLIEQKYAETGLPIVILGKAYKPESNLTVGSGATLVVNLLDDRGIECQQIDPIVDDDEPVLVPAIYFVATNHKIFSKYFYPRGSVIIDLWRYIPKSKDYEVIYVGNSS